MERLSRIRGITGAGLVTVLSVSALVSISGLRPSVVEAKLIAKATPAPPRASLASDCDGADKSFSVTATMRPVDGTQKLNVKFLLLAKPSGADAFELVPTAGLGKWTAPTSPPTLGQRPGDVWNVTQPVAGLTAKTKYRFRVGFRWLGDHHKVLKTETLLSKVCAIPASRYASKQS